MKIPILSSSNIPTIVQAKHKRQSYSHNAIDNNTNTTHELETRHMESPFQSRTEFELNERTNEVNKHS